MSLASFPRPLKDPDDKDHTLGCQIRRFTQWQDALLAIIWTEQLHWYGLRDDITSRDFTRMSEELAQDIFGFPVDDEDCLRILESNCFYRNAVFLRIAKYQVHAPHKLDE